MNNLPPLAERMRPKNLDDYVGQKHLVGKGAVLRKAIESGVLPSMIFWGPPGVGKTTLAYIISQTLYRPFFALSAINSGVKDVREVIEKAALLKEHFQYYSSMRYIASPNRSRIPCWVLWSGER
jgi:putative ATPase